eukprot:jgi/Chlat1/3126/Chrsp21S03359
MPIRYLTIEKSGKSFDQIASELGVTNAYAAQLFLNQAQLKPHTAEKLKKAVPALTDEQVATMSKPPLRTFDERIVHDPTVYRLREAMNHYSLAIKELINEKFGDGIMSAINFFCAVDKVKGSDGEDRVVITLNGKFLPYNEQRADQNTANLAERAADE